MPEMEQVRFMQVQLTKIQVDKWCAGCGMQRDPGSDYVLDWIAKHAQWFRSEWEHSRCRECSSWRDCGHLLKQDCHTYQKINA